MTGLSIGNALSIGKGLSFGSGLGGTSGLYFDGYTYPAALSLDFSNSTLSPLITFGVSGGNTGIGTLYDSSGYLTYRPNNLLLNSATLSTQNVTTTAAQPYILSFKGTGSIARSGTSTGTLAGTGENDRVYVKFTATAGTLTLTVTGTVTEAQLEAVTYETTPRAYNPTTSTIYYGPRFDYNPAHGQSGGLWLQEGSRSNGFGFSTNLSVAGYVKTNTTATLSAELGPDNYTAAYYVTATSANGNIKVNSGAGTTLGRCVSVFLRRKTGTGTITFGAGSTTVDCTAVPSSGWTRYQVNLTGQAGTYSVTSNVVTVTLTAHGFSTGDSIRADFTSGTAVDTNATSITVTDANTFTFALTTADTSGNVTIYPTLARLTLATNADEVYAWGWQFEFGYGASSYLPTGGASVTRGTELYTISGSNFSSWFSQSGSFVCEFVPSATVTLGSIVVPGGIAGATSSFFSITAGVATAWGYVYTSSANITLRADSGTSGSSLVTFSGPVAAGTLYRVGQSINSATNQTFAKTNGQSLVKGVVNGLPTPTILYFGQSGSGTNAGFYWIKSFTFYQQPLSSGQLEVLVP